MLRFIRYFLASILLVIAINAFGGGVYGMAGARGLPLIWLNGSPFRSYFVPSLFLFSIVGISCFLSSTLLFRNSAYSKKSAMSSGILLVSWIVIQVWMIGYVSWLQPVIFVSGITVIILDLFLLRERAV
jgi:hypothetical protein